MTRVQTQLIMNLFNGIHHSAARQNRPGHLRPSRASSKIADAVRLDASVPGM